MDSDCEAKRRASYLQDAISEDLMIFTLIEERQKRLLPREPKARGLHDHLPIPAKQHVSGTRKCDGHAKSRLYALRVSKPSPNGVETVAKPAASNSTFTSCLDFSTRLETTLSVPSRHESFAQDFPPLDSLAIETLNALTLNPKA